MFIKLICCAFSVDAEVIGINTTKITASVGVQLWNDRKYTITELPGYLDGAILFQGPHSPIAAETMISITASRTSTLYIAISNNRNGGLPDTLQSDGWKLTDGNVIYTSNSNGLNFRAFMNIWTESVAANSTTKFALPVSDVTLAIFVANGACMVSQIIL